MNTTALLLPPPRRVAPVRASLAPPHPRSRAVARVTRLAQVVLGLIWLIDGALQFQPYMFGKGFITGVIDPSAVGQPGIIADPIIWIANLIGPHVALFNGFAATLQILIGLGLLHRRTVKPALIVSFAWALGIWFTGEGLGMILTGSANPLTGAPGAALLYVVAGLLCWPRTASDPAGGAPAERFGLLGERGARGVWGALWLDALRAQPGAGAGARGGTAEPVAAADPAARPLDGGIALVGLPETLHPKWRPRITAILWPRCSTWQDHAFASASLPGGPGPRPFRHNVPGRPTSSPSALRRETDVEGADQPRRPGARSHPAGHARVVDDHAR